MQLSAAITVTIILNNPVENTRSIYRRQIREKIRKTLTPTYLENVSLNETKPQNLKKNDTKKKKAFTLDLDLNLDLDSSKDIRNIIINNVILSSLQNNIEIRALDQGLDYAPIEKKSMNRNFTGILRNSAGECI